MYIMINHYYTFTGLEFYNFTIFDQKICFKIFGKVKKITTLVGFKLLTYRFVFNALTHCTMLLDKSFRKENICKIILYYIV